MPRDDLDWPLSFHAGCIDPRTAVARVAAESPVWPRCTPPPPRLTPARPPRGCLVHRIGHDRAAPPHSACSAEGPGLIWPNAAVPARAR